MKMVVVPSNISNIDKYEKIGADAFIFGLKDYCSGYNLELSLDEIKELKNITNKEIFVAINKNIFNSELEYLEKALKELDDIKVNGVLFYDLSILSIKKRLNLNLDLVWNQTHMVTNYNTCNYYYDKGVKYGILASEITLEEMKEIKEKTNMSLFANVFGYQTMSYTRRNLLKNYFLSTNKEKTKDEYIITNKDEEYIIKEEKHGNNILFGKVLNGSVIIPELGLDYVILNDFNIEEKLFENVLNLYKKLIDTKDLNIAKEIDELVGDYRGFLFQKTIYKVKKNA